MASNLADVGIVNDEFAFSDAYRQEFANALPGNGVKILKITDEAFRIHRAIDHFGCVIGLFRKRQQVRQLLLIEIQRRAVSRPMQADISHGPATRPWFRSDAEGWRKFDR